MKYRIKHVFVPLALVLFCFLFTSFGINPSLTLSQTPLTVIQDGLDSQERRLSQAGGYALTKQWQDNDNSYHYIATYKGGEDQYQSSKIIQNIHLVVSFREDKTFQIKMLDNDKERWQIPERYPFPYFESGKNITVDLACCTVEIQPDPFGFVVTRKDTKQILFDTRNKELVYSDLYIQLSSALPSDNVYGFGERNFKFKLSPGIYTIWGRDDPMILENGEGGGNTYSQHPVGLFRDKNKDFYMIYLRNINAMDVIVEKDSSLTFKVVGGIIDLVFFVGDAYPESVIKSYHSYLGKFMMMPFWSMGYQQSKWGYSNYAVVEDVIQRYNKYDIPLDVMWSDIDYMIDKEIFTVDSTNFPPERMKEIQTKYKKKWVPIIDPGVKIRANGPGLQAGLDKDVYLRNNKGNYLVGSVWPGRVYFTDFFHPNTEQYWSEMLEILYEMIPFNGLWLDMNEVANFVDGEDQRFDRSVYDNIPYTPGRRPLKRKTISLDAVHYGNYLEYDVHGLFGLMECASTYKYLETKSKLPFILTRASSPGMGRFAAHWSGDNGAHWDFLRVSIPGNFNFQIFGMPFVGADICGFMDGTNEELCARWVQVGALYPFARNHHEEKTRNQEPWTFSGKNLGVSILETTRAAVKMRYAILKWYYSLFIEKNGLGSIFKPLMFEFPQEDELYNDGYNDWEFLIGSSLLCTPKVEAGEPFVNAYFPLATWYDLFTGAKFIAKEDHDRVKRVETPFNGTAPLFLRAGHIIHKQIVDKVLTTEDLDDEFELVIGLERRPEDGLLEAHGSIMGVESFDDDTIYHRCMEDNCLYNINVTVPQSDSTSATIQIQLNRQKENAKVPLDDIGVYGIRVYGLPLNFMSEDAQKIGFGLLQIIRGGEPAQTIQIKKLSPLAINSFWIDFGSAIRVQEGDIIQIELIL